VSDIVFCWIWCGRAVSGLWPERERAAWASGGSSIDGRRGYTIDIIIAKAADNIWMVVGLDTNDIDSGSAMIEERHKIEREQRNMTSIGTAAV
jgi:hypothetical protein